MKNPLGITVRYLGSNVASRLFCVQRGDSKYLTVDGGWSRVLDEAKVYRTHKDAQIACSALQCAMYRGKPLRTFEVTVTVSLVADDVEQISQEELARFLGEATTISVDNVAFGDGPRDQSFVQLRMILRTLEESASPRRQF